MDGNFWQNLRKNWSRKSGQESFEKRKKWLKSRDRVTVNSKTMSKKKWGAFNGHLSKATFIRQDQLKVIFLSWIILMIV